MKDDVRAAPKEVNVFRLLQKQKPGPKQKKGDN
jgi:hypothetical protein